jgi:glyoxylase-like metal-dependent hydrolase (beta-lactamase superfamily II)
VIRVCTPGHRRALLLLVVDGSRGGPWLVITGDSLLIGDAARPIWPASDRRRDRPTAASEAAQAPRRVELYPGT